MCWQKKDKNDLVHPAPDKLKAVDTDDVGSHVNDGGRGQRRVVDGDGQVLLRIESASRQVKSSSSHAGDHAKRIGDLEDDDVEEEEEKVLTRASGMMAMSIMPM